MGRRNIGIAIAAVLILFTINSPGICDDEPPVDTRHKWDWLVGGKLSGELGTRYKIEKSASEEDTLFQMQLNLDYEVELSDYWEWAIGLRTGTTGRPTRGWVRRDAFFDEKTFFIRPWTVTHSGKMSGGKLKTTLGAFEYPFDQSGTVFDGDVIRQGVTQQLSLDLRNDRLKLGWSAQYLQNGDAYGDAWVVAGDASLRFQRGGSSRTTIQASYIDFLNVDTIGQAIVEDRLFVSGHAPTIGTTNFITEEGDFASDFNILLLRAEHECRRQSDWPVDLWGEYIINYGAAHENGSKDKGYAVGMDLGSKGDKGNIFFGVSYLALEDDAVLELYNRGKLGTNAKGWTTDLRYQLHDDLLLRLEGFWLKTKSPREDIDSFNNRTIQVSLIYEFG